MSFKKLTKATTSSVSSEEDEQVAVTKRLILSRLHLDDAGVILELFKSPGWITFIGKHKTYTKKIAEKYLTEGPIRSYDDNGWGLYKVSLKKSKRVVGICGIVKRHELTEPDLGFALLPKYEGKGYALEAATRVLLLAKKKFELPKLLAITQKNNARSIALLERLGFVLSQKNTERISSDTALYVHSLILL